MKKNYVKPTAEVNKFALEDIITTSGNSAPGIFEGYGPDSDNVDLGE